MNFAEWFRRRETIKIFVDFDHTLVNVIPKSSDYYQGEKFDVPCNYDVEGEFVAYVRPGAREFMKALEVMGDVAILTFGLTENQKSIAQIVGLDYPVYGRDQYDQVPKSTDGYLVDDRGFMDSLTQYKMHAIGIQDRPQNIVKVLEFYAGETDDNELQHILDVVKAKIESKNFNN